jgi:L-ascorbate metabolism protein UlaG (beta-lactamase superfamily)
MTDARTALSLSKFRHSCLLVELGDARILLDPGVFSAGFESLTDLSAILVTHQHPDHLDANRLAALVQANPGVQVLADTASAAQLADVGVTAAAMNPGDTADVGGVSVAIYGGTHAQIAPGVPVPPNVGYTIDGRFAYAGDAHTPPPGDVQVLAIPAAAPWLKAAETIAFLQQVKPQAVVPVHDAVLAEPGTSLYYGLYQRFASEQGTEFRVLDTGGQRTSF